MKAPPTSNARVCLAASLLFLTMTGLGASPSIIDPPSGGTFVIDAAGSLGKSDLSRFQALCEKLYSEKATPVVLAVIPSIGGRGAAVADGWTVSSYARAVVLDWISRPSSPVPSAAPIAEPNQESGKPTTPESQLAAVVAPAKTGGFPLAAFAGRGLLILISLEDERVAVASGPEWLPRSHLLRRLEIAFASRLETGDLSLTLAQGGEAVAALVRRHQVPLPGELFLAMFFGVLFVLIMVTIIAYFRNGSTSLAVRSWTTVFSSLGIALSFLMRRGIRLTSALSQGKGVEVDKDRIVVGRW